MSAKKIDAKELMKQGWIHVLITFEVIGRPKLFVDSTLKQYIAQIKDNENIHFVEQHLGKAAKTDFKAESSDEEYFSAFAEVDMLVKKLETMTWLAVNFMPASIEIIEPNEFRFSALDLQNWQNDILSKLHSVDARFKQQTSQLGHIQMNLVQLMQNMVLVALARGPKMLSELVKETTITEKALGVPLKKLLEDKRIIEHSGVYKLA